MAAKIDQLIDVLSKLKNASYQDREAARVHHAAAAEALRLIFHIGLEQPSFTEQQKEQVAKNIAAAIIPIQMNIEIHGYEFMTKLDTIILTKRSALQFLLDFYGTFPFQGETLSDVFEKANLMETIGILDEIISYHLISEAYSDTESDEARSDRNFPGIPSSHTWWA